jgi:Rrf2 family transcriptional regulator, cysteine metabolism repressor
MKISTKGRYGLRAMIELAIKYGQGPVMLSTLASELGVSRKYLHTLLVSLKAGELVRSIKGPGGGFVLAKAPEQISLDTIIYALEGELSVVECVLDAAVCKKTGHCVARDVWEEVGQAMHQVLSKKTLSELAAQQNKQSSTDFTYQI